MDNKLEKIVGISKEEILQKAKAEYDKSIEYVRPRRVQFRDRIRLYNNQRKQADKIGIPTLYTIINTLLAVYYTDEMSVEFVGRRIANQIFTDNINNTAKFDHDEMNMDVINYFVQWDKFFYGVGLRDLSTFNITTNTPSPTSIDPLSWLPDPAGGLNPKGNHFNMRFYGFEVDRTKQEMEEMNFINLENLSACSRDDEAEQTRIAQNEAYGLNTQERRNVVNSEYGDYAQIDWYTSLKNENGGVSKYLITVDPNFTELFRIEKIIPVTAEEKKDESLVPFPLVCNYYSPQRNNPFGVSVSDLIEDKQRAKSILANLRIAKEKSELYPMYLYNTAKIKNRRDLDFGFNKAVGVNLSRGEMLNNVAMPLQKDPNKAMTFNQEDSLDAEARISTGADQMQSGVMSDQARTLGEVQQVTSNAQLRFLLGTRINAWGEKLFWKLWYRMYRLYLSQSQKKFIRLQSSIGTKFITITRKDFITSEDPDVLIASKGELEVKRQKIRISFMQVAPMLLQDPTRPQASRRFIERQMLRLNDISQDMIEVMSPLTPDEMEANEENELLGRNMFVKINEQDDHLSHIIIHDMGEDTPAKFAHIQAHKLAFVLSGQKAAQDAMQAAAAQNMDSAANMSAASVSQQAMQQNGTNQSITPTNQ